MKVTHYTDTELESLLDDIESDLTERKESWNGDALLVQPTTVSCTLRKRT